jgi:hypothetical protein
MNTAVGNLVLNQSTQSSFNTAVGTNNLNVLSFQDASMNVALGCNSMLYAKSSFHNTCVGANSCGHNDPNPFGTMTTLGFSTGVIDYQGVNNTFLGAFADSVPYGGGDYYTNSTALGYNAKITDSHQIMLGMSAEYIQVPGSAKVQGNVDISGNLSVHPGTIYGTVLPYSDERLKEEATPLSPVLPAVLQLQPKRFRWKESQKEDVGFIAQEFYGVMGPDLWPTDSIHTAPNGFLTLDYAKMVVFLTKAVKELEQEYEELQAAAALL